MATENKVYEGTYQGEKAVWLKAGRYEAAVLPEFGANLIAFRDTEKGYHFLREPEAGEMEAFKASPCVHGIPVLFPPNRYEDGKFPWKGKVYEFPVNEPATNNHLHGFLHTIPWDVDYEAADEQGSRITLSVKIKEGHPVYRYLPHEFTFTLSYTLNETGLFQQVYIRNDGKDTMPCLLAFHTAFNAPFVPGSTPEDQRIKLTIGERWEMSDRMLPTGRYQPLGADEAKMKSGETSPYFAAMDNHYTALPQNGRNCMVLTDTRANVKLVYDVGTAYKQWMIWNNGNCRKYFCPEPQMNLVNAPNMNLPADDIGLIGLEPGEVFEETSRIYVIEG